MAARKVRIYQEDWLPFQNLPAAVAAFERATGIGVELAWDKVGVGTIEHMFDQMARSFGGRRSAVRPGLHGRGHAARLRAARPGAGARRLDGARRHHPRRLHAPPPSRPPPTRRLHRPALRQRQQHAALPPRPARPLRPAGARRLGRAEAGRARCCRTPCAATPAATSGPTRPAAPAAAAIRSGPSARSWAPSAARWLDGRAPAGPVAEAKVAAMACYADLLAAVAPPDQAHLSFVEMRGAFAEGRVGIIMDVGMEYAHVLATNPELAEKSGVALVPAGPAGRAPNLYSPLVGDSRGLAGRGRGLGAGQVAVQPAPAAGGRPALQRARDRVRCPCSTAPSSTATSAPISWPRSAPAAPSPARSARSAISASRPTSSSARPSTTRL